MQAVKTNVIGSDNVIEAATATGVRSVVCLSTDKAVYPINAMGMSKAMMEKIAQAFARNQPDSPTTVSVTRYGNVMYSRGSVIPLFVRQLAGRAGRSRSRSRHDPLPDVAGGVGRPGRARLPARQPGRPVRPKAPASTVGDPGPGGRQVLGHGEPEVHVIGMRHGEKMYETLLTREEMRPVRGPGRLLRVPAGRARPGLRGVRRAGRDAVAPRRDYDSTNTEAADRRADRGRCC